MDKRGLLKERIKQHVEVANALFNNSENDMLKLFDVCINSLKNGGKILFFGNGGSASQAEHIVGELVGRFYKIRKAIPAVALTANPATVTAIANDSSFEEIFSRQIEALGKKGDIAIGLSTSGNSKNIVKAMELANKIGLYTVAFTGLTGGNLKDIVKLCIKVPSQDTPRIQEMHILLGHILCEAIEEALY